MGYITHDGTIHPDAPSYSDALRMIAELEDKVAGYKRTVDRQARDVGGLERRLLIENDPAQHPKGKEIVDLIDRWKAATVHPNAVASEDRFKLIKARLKDGYSVEQVELAIDGLGAFPYIVDAKRSPTGKPSQRYDQMKHALSGGEKLEQLANLGAQARSKETECK